jgi:hypothetical protein
MRVNNPDRSLVGSAKSRVSVRRFISTKLALNQTPVITVAGLTPDTQYRFIIVLTRFGARSKSVILT